MALYYDWWQSIVLVEICHHMAYFCCMAYFLLRISYIYGVESLAIKTRKNWLFFNLANMIVLTKCCPFTHFQGKFSRAISPSIKIWRGAFARHGFNTAEKAIKN